MLVRCSACSGEITPSAQSARIVGNLIHTQRETPISTGYPEQSREATEPADAHSDRVMLVGVLWGWMGEGRSSRRVPRVLGWASLWRS
jgi:hypothetical protein